MLIEFALMILRVFVGLLFAAHGAQKLFGWFGGRGLKATAAGLGTMGLHPAWLWAWTSALAEFGGGALLALGVLTPVAAAALICTMVMAIAKVHGRKGFWNTNGGYEFNLTLIAAALTIGLAGPGAYALNPAIFARWPQLPLFVASLVVGLIGVAFGLIISLRQPQIRPQTGPAKSK